ncbi:hypothetical protein AAG570_005814 [Ranatra chinensis]|uniref:LDLR chaperone boca n=1 Tax=Ranatra chinensis TaxID=642074 RepID=A0ABD0XYI9_9HEMI
MERLLDQWEEDEEPLEPDELPEHLRPSPQVDFSKIKGSNPEELLQMTKKGRTLMTFVTVAGTPSRETTEDLTKLWQTSLWNNHIQAERYVIDDNRAIFMFKDGSQAWEAKDYLIDQPECKEVSIENKIYPGKYSETVCTDLQHTNSKGVLRILLYSQYYIYFVDSLFIYN